MKRFNYFIILLFLVFALLGNIAQAYDFEKDSGLKTTGNSIGYKTNQRTLSQKIGSIINIFMLIELLGVVFMGLVIYGGYNWMTAGGNDEKATKGRNILISAIIGLIIVLTAYAITSFIMGSF